MENIITTYNTAGTFYYVPEFSGVAKIECWGTGGKGGDGGSNYEGGTGGGAGRGYSTGNIGAYGGLGQVKITITPTPSGSTMKHFNGTAWVDKPLKVYNGTAWVSANLKRYNGSAWVAA